MHKRIKDISGIIICLAFTALGLFLYSPDMLFPTLFFGIGSLFLIFDLFRKKKISLSDDFEISDLEYYDWGFYDELNEQEYYWENIKKIIAYKEDLLTVDHISLSIEFDNIDDFTIHESTPGWHQFIIRMEKEIEINKEWLKEVTLPPFERCEILVYQRPTFHQTL